MLHLRVLLWLGLLVVGDQLVTGLQCYSCTNARTNQQCKKMVTCRGAENSCQNTVRMENGITFISKGCQQLTACRDGSKQNRYQCSPTAREFLNGRSLKATKNLPPSTCRSCCTTSRCNSRLFLKESTSLPGRLDKNKWASVQPSITNVRVTRLISGTALITFTDSQNHSSDFFDVQLTPKVQKIFPIVVEDNPFPEIKLNIPEGSLAYLATDLSAGVLYSVQILSTKEGKLSSRKIYKSFITRPRPPVGVWTTSSRVTSLSVMVGRPLNRKGDRVSYYTVSYRKASEPPQKARLLPRSNRPGIRVIRNLEPATQYIIQAWTNVADRQGRLFAASKRITAYAFTAVPGLENLEVQRLHATNITWTFRVPSYVKTNQQEKFLASVRDVTDGRQTAETTLPSTKRDFTATGLIPNHAYTLTIKAQLKRRESGSLTSSPSFTLIRCYICDEAKSATECDRYEECPSDARGCLNEIRRRSVTNRGGGAIWYRASMGCKQVAACNSSAIQDSTEQCSNATGEYDAPEVCRCCCEGDLCNGPGNTCGHLLRFLGQFRAPEPVIVNPPFCSPLEFKQGTFKCSNEYEVGSTCTFQCSEDEYLVGDEQVKCFDGGSWSGSVPRCAPRKICPDLEASQGMTVTCSNGFKAGSRCRIRCDTGYVRAGEATSECLKSGKWSHPFTPRCFLVDFCQPNPCMNGATCHSVPNDYECQCVPGFTGRNCSREVVCEELEPPKNGKLQCTDSNRYLSRCRYSCDVGYEQHGSTYTRCLADEYWSAFEPTLCVIKSCPVPPQRLVNDGRTHCSGFEFGDTCHFTCPPGMTLAGGPPKITCQADETWSEKDLPCCDLQCPPHARVDLYFLLDSSSSVGKMNWNILIDFTVAMLDQFVLGPDDMRVGVGRYNSKFDTENEILFGDYKDYDDLKNKLYKMPYNGRGTKTGKALKHVYETSLNTSLNRPNVTDILIVITDGRSEDKVAAPAALIKSNKETKVYAIGVLVDERSSVNEKQLNTIASGPRYVHVITDGFTQLVEKLSSILTEDVCWIPCEFQYGLREIYLRQRQLAAQTGDELDAAYWSMFDAKNSTTTAPDVTNSVSTKIIAPVDPVEGGRPIIEEEN